MMLLQLLRKGRRKSTKNINQHQPTHSLPILEVIDKHASVDEDLQRTTKSPPVIFALAQQQSWQAVIFRCTTHPHELIPIFQDSNGETLLHWICFGSPPLDVVAQVLHLCPDLAKIQNKKGQLPLHVACAYRASPGVTRSLVQAFDTGPAVADCNGACALHILCDYGCSVDSIYEVLKTNSGAETTRRRESIFFRKPLHILNERKSFIAFHKTMQELRERREFERNMVPNPCRDQLYVGCMRDVDLWRKTALLVRAEHSGRAVVIEGESLDTGLLNMFVVSCSCPSSLKELATLILSDQLMVMNQQGDLALHTAIKAEDFAMATDLLHGNPASASVRDRGDNFPMQLLCLNYRHKTKSLNLMLELIRAYPQALGTLALERSLNTRVWAKFNGRKDVNTLFQLIRAAPLLFGCRRQ